MINEIYSVVHVQDRKTDFDPSGKKTILKDRWFADRADAKKFYDQVSLGIYTIDLKDGESRYTSERKEVRKHILDAKAKALLASNPRFDAEALAWELELDSRGGELVY